MNQPEPNEINDISIVDLSGLIFGSDYLDDPRFHALPSEVKKAWIDADEKGELIGAREEEQYVCWLQESNSHKGTGFEDWINQFKDRIKEDKDSRKREEESLKKLQENQAREKIEQELLKELRENQAREVEEHNKRVEVEEHNKRVMELIEKGEIADRLIMDLAESYYSNIQTQAEHEEINAKISIKVDHEYTKTTDKEATRQPIGTQYIQVPHVDKGNLDKLKGFYLTYGNTQCVYKFSSRKEIKIFVKDREEGIRVINKLLKIVRHEKLEGDAKAHCSFTEVREKKKAGMKGTLTHLHTIDSTGKRELYEFKSKAKLKINDRS